MKRTDNLYVYYNAEDAKNNNIIGRRIQTERKARGYTLDQLRMELEKHGVSVLRGAISKWELGVTLPNCYQLLALCAALDIDEPVSVLTGKDQLNDAGKRKLSEYKKDLIDSGNYVPDIAISVIKYIRMPVSMLRASAGTGNYLDEDSFEMVSFPANTVPDGADFGVRVTGDSMEPVYSNGQIVWVRRCSELSNGEVGIFVLDGNGYIKMFGNKTPDNIEEYTDSEGRLHMQPVLISYNSKYSPIEVTADMNLQIIGKVL